MQPGYPECKQSNHLKMELGPMRDAYDRVYKKQKLCEAQSEEIISAMTHDINLAVSEISSDTEDEPFRVQRILSDLQGAINQIGPLNQLGSQQNDMNAALVKYGEVLDKQFHAKLTNAHMDVDFDTHVLNKIIAQHFFRLGQYDTGDLFMQETQEVESTLKTSFIEMHHILEQLKLRNLKPALDWARMHHNALLQKCSSLELNLHELEFVRLLQGGSRRQALQYAKANFVEFANSHMGKIQRLMGSLLWAGRLEHSPYQDLLQTSNWDLVGIQFVKECCHLMGYSYQSALEVAVSAGMQAIPTILKMVLLFGKNKKGEWLASKQLPLEIELDKEHQFHSIFACPVSKEQSSTENPPMLMPCGHVLCQDSLQRLSKSRIFKCPYCPIVVNMAQCKPIYF